MNQWWKQESSQNQVMPERSAVAYYRHSAQDRQKNSVEIQSDQVRAWAAKNEVTIIEEFADHGKSGLTAEGRDGFNAMMEQVRTRKDFTFILVLDVSRWGRFQDTDLSAEYSSECKRHGKRVVYTTLGVTEDGSPVYPLLVNFERWRSAQYSRELSDKVFKGCVKISQQGYRAGGSAPYGLHRLMVNEQDKPEKVLSPGERKSIQNWRVKLIRGEATHVEIIKELFQWFTVDKMSEQQIAGRLNNQGVPSPGGVQWSAGGVRRLLQNETYAGAVVYNRTSAKLKTPRKDNPEKDWVIKPEAYENVIDRDMFIKAQEVFAARFLRFDPAWIATRMRDLYQRYGIITDRVLRKDPERPSMTSIDKYFGGWRGAQQSVWSEINDKVRAATTEELRSRVENIQVCDDFLVLNELCSVLIQPCVPVEYGFDLRWSFRPDPRPMVDLTLGVVVADRESAEIAGYVLLPRLIMDPGWYTLSGGNGDLADIYGTQGLDFVKELAHG